MPIPSRLRSLPLVFWLAAGASAPGVLAAVPARKVTLLPSDSAGKIPASFSVTGNGAASYVIPIEVPPGTNGVQPVLNLAYDSHAGNGYLGQGFELRGISAITRCTPERLVPGDTHEIHYSGSDRFCVDGVPLVKVGEDSEGDDGPGTVYYTERQTWTKLISYQRVTDDTGSYRCAGPCYFRAWNKDGEILEFGHTRDSRIFARGTSAVRVWAQNRFEDLNGNYTEIAYFNDPAKPEYYLLRIRYTGNRSAGLTPQRRVEFRYENRRDTARRFHGSGVAVEQTQRLSLIRTSVGGRTVLEYRLAYRQSADTGTSLLERIDQCDGAGVCRGTSFTWLEQRSFQQLHERHDWSCRDEGASPAWIDFDGDGRADLACSSGATGSHRVLLSKPGGPVSPPETLDDGGLLVSGWICRGQLGWGDFDGNGRSDLMCSEPDRGLQRVLLSNGTRLLQPDGEPPSDSPSSGLVASDYRCPTDTGGRFAFLDFDGDGRTDVLCAQPDAGSYSVWVSTGTSLVPVVEAPVKGQVRADWRCPAGSGELSFADFNGDGLADVQCSEPAAGQPVAGRYRVLVSTGKALVAPPADRSGAGLVRSAWPCTGGARVTWADFNGDRLADLLCADPHGQHRVLLSTGGAALTYVFGSGGSDDVSSGSFTCTDPGATLEWMDGNGDGRADLACFRQGSGLDWVLVSRGESSLQSGPPMIPSSLVGYGSDGCDGTVTWPDFAGTGSSGIACWDPADDHFWVKTLSGQGGTLTPLLLETITDGLGGRVTVEYAPLTDPEVYRRTEPSVTSHGTIVRAVQPPLFVVQAYTLADVQQNAFRPSGGDAYTFEYSYRDAKVEVGGRGWLGFAEVRMARADPPGPGSRAFYLQDAGHVGLLDRVDHHDAAGGLVARTQHAYSDISIPEHSALGIHQRVLVRQENIQYEDGHRVSEVAMEYGYDDYGNLVRVGDLGAAREEGDEFFTCTYYLVYTPPWHIGYPLEQKTTSTREACDRFLADAADQGASWQEGDFSWRKIVYDSRMNLAFDGSWDEDHQQFLGTSYRSDEFGNRISSTGPDGSVTELVIDPLYHSFVAEVRLPENALGERLTTVREVEPLFGRLLRVVDPNGNVFRSEIDGFGRDFASYGPDPEGGEALLSYTRFQRDEAGFFVETRQTASWGLPPDRFELWQRSYFDGLGRAYRTERSAEPPHRAIVEEVAFDAAGLEAARSLPHFEGDEAHWITTSYDSRNRPVATVQPDGVVEHLEYRLGEHRIRRTFAFGTAEARTETSYVDARGRVKERVSPNGLRQQYHYDLLGRLQELATSPADRRLTLERDSLGRVRSVTSTDRGTVRLNYDAAGRLSSRLDSLGNRLDNLAFDSLGRVTLLGLTGPGGRFAYRQELVYDEREVANGLGNLTTVRTTYTDDPGSGRPHHWSYRISYDAQGQYQALRLETDGTHAWSGAVAFGYDPLGRLQHYVYPDGAIRSYAYGLDGGLRRVELRESPTAPATPYLTYWGYDALGRWDLLRHDNGAEIDRVFYPATEHLGKLASVRGIALRPGDARAIFERRLDWTSTGEVKVVESRHHDALKIDVLRYQDDPANPGMGYLTSVLGPYYTQRFHYDLLGNRITANDESYAYSPGTSRLASTSGGTSYHYDANGNLVERIRPDGTGEAFFYDALNRVVGIGPRLQGDLEPTAAEHLSLSAGEHFRHDFLGLLFHQAKDGTATLWMPHFEISFQAGDRLETKYVPGTEGVAVAITRRAPATEPRVRNALALSRLYSRGSFRSLWYAARAQAPSLQVTLVVLPLSLAAIAVVWLLASAGRLRAGVPRRRGRLSCIGGGRLRPVWVPLLIAGLLVAPNAAGDLVGDGKRIEGVRYLLKDHLMSTVAVTDENGAETAYLSYLPFGEIDQLASSGRDDFLPKFGGHAWLGELGLYDFGARFYDPGIGRFISPDPASQYLSPYLFAANSPESYIDPDGEFVFLIAMIVVGALVGAYMGASAVNHDFNPAHWDWRSGKTYAGLFGGAAIGALGAAVGVMAAEAGVAAGIVGEAFVGGVENASFTAMGGGSAKEILISAGEGAAFGAAFGALGSGLGSAASRFGRRGAANAEASLEELGAEGCTCFAAGTEVLTEAGPKAVEAVEVGERVWAKVETQGTADLRAVTQVFERTTGEVVRIAAGEVVIEATPEHRFWVDGLGWLQAQDLSADDSLSDLEGGGVPIEGWERVDGSYQVHNLEVEEAHTYFVSSEHVLVHNPCPFSPRTLKSSLSDEGRGLGLTEDARRNLEIAEEGRAFTGLLDSRTGEIHFAPLNPTRKTPRAWWNFWETDQGAETGGRYSVRGTRVDPLQTPPTGAGPAHETGHAQLARLADVPEHEAIGFSVTRRGQGFKWGFRSNTLNSLHPWDGGPATFQAELPEAWQRALQSLKLPVGPPI